jgi:hypothetical protein
MRKNVFLFIGGFISCFIVVMAFVNFNIYSFNKTENVKDITEIKNTEVKPEYIFSVEKYEGGYAAKYDNIDLTTKEGQNQEEYKIDTSHITYSNKSGEPKIDYKVWINGIEKDIKAIQYENETYINIRELKESLNNLNVLVLDEEKVLNIYEMTGLGIINNNGKQYIDIGKLASRYSVPFDRLPYTYEGDHQQFMDSKNNKGVASIFRIYPKWVGPLPPDIKPEFPEYHFYGTIIVTRDYLIENLPIFLKILCSNELFIKEHPGALYKSNE